MRIQCCGLTKNVIKYTDFKVNHPEKIMKMDSFDKIIIATIVKPVVVKIMDELNPKALDKKR